MTTEHKIEWKATDRSDRKAILVDGLEWGFTITTGHGMHGKSYEFFQTGGEQIVRVDPKAYRGYRDVVVRSQSKSDRRRAGEEGVDSRPTEQRITDTARVLIADSLLRHPNTVRTEIKLRQRHAELAASEREAAKETAFRDRAAACLPERGSTMSELLEADAVDKIVAAMKWAQVQ